MVRFHFTVLGSGISNKGNPHAFWILYTRMCIAASCLCSHHEFLETKQIEPRLKEGNFDIPINIYKLYVGICSCLSGLFDVSVCQNRSRRHQHTKIAWLPRLACCRCVTSPGLIIVIVYDIHFSDVYLSTAIFQHLIPRTLKHSVARLFTSGSSSSLYLTRLTWILIAIMVTTFI